MWLGIPANNRIIYSFCRTLKTYLKHVYIFDKFNMAQQLHFSELYLKENVTYWKVQNLDRNFKIWLSCFTEFSVVLLMQYFFACTYMYLK